MRGRLIAALDFAGLAGRWRARRRAQLLEFMRWNTKRTLADSECPRCHFLNPVDAEQPVLACGWCGEPYERIHANG